MIRASRILPRLLPGAILLVLASCATTSRLPPAERPDITANVSFPEIERFTRAYRVMRYESDRAIRRAVAPAYDEFALVDLPKTRNRYMIGTSLADHRQDIWIRGTANLPNAGYDLDYGLHHNDELGIDLHKGFEAITLTLYREIRPQLRPDFDLVIFGHSLGAAEAVILGMLLWNDHYRVERIYASGAPRVTTESGAAKWSFLPILRIVNVGDPVPFLPPRNIVTSRDPYTHLGNVLVLFDGPYYSLLGPAGSDDLLAGAVQPEITAETLPQQVKMHLTPAYIAREEEKLVEAVQVPFADAAAYLPPKPKTPEPPRPGRGPVGS